MMSCFRAKKDKEAENEKALMVNGRLLLETSVSNTNGRGNPIRCFSAKELKYATNNYDRSQVYWDDGLYILYNGILPERKILLKKYEDKRALKYNISEIVFASQTSSHRNAHKLFGCCLETEIPILVFESAENGTLHDRIYNPHILNFQPLPWKIRLKIAVDVANVIAYLHTAFRRPIVHKDIKPSNILLDEDHVPKLTDFSLSEMIPEDQSHLEHKVSEPLPDELHAGYFAPEIFSTGIISEKFDVYSFGVLLLSLLTSKTAKNPFPEAFPENHSLVQCVKELMETNKFDENVVDPSILEEGAWQGKEQQLQNYIMLALQCACDLEDDRPSMTQVAKKLVSINQSVISNYRS